MPGVVDNVTLSVELVPLTVPVPKDVMVGLNHWKVIPVALVVPVSTILPPGQTDAVPGLALATGSAFIVTVTLSVELQPSV